MMIVVGVVVIVMGLVSCWIGHKKAWDIMLVEGFIVSCMGLVLCFMKTEDVVLKITQLLLS